MELLLRLMDRRLLLLGGLLLMTLWFADQIKTRYGDSLRARFAPPKSTALDPRLAAPIAAANDAGARAKVGSLYRVLLAELDAAENQGFDVSAQRDAAAKVFALNSEPAYRDAALERLNRLRVSIPRKLDGVRAAPNELPTPAPAPKARTRSYRR